tara:strand:- start:233 stop:646 length:414 start_codon:yes stop_codon:yes gene_type:complete
MLDILRFNYYFYQINDVILMKSLGKTLKEKRESIGFTLREVEDTTGVSNAYLSQLENDKIKKPSANILYKLSNLYKLQLNELLIEAGVIEAPDEDSVKSRNLWLDKIAFYEDKLSEEDRSEVLRYIKFKYDDSSKKD